MAKQDMESLRILHISDTHGLHRRIEDDFPMPDADILIHTGDFTDEGTLEEIDDFNSWLGELQRYPHKIVIFGNHEYKARIDPKCVKQLLPGATVLEHEAVEILGLRIFGSSWVPGHASAAPGDAGKVPHRFCEIPEDVDILLTHGSPYDIMDYCELGSMPHWGGSKALRQEILRAKPRAHLFGHMHEQRGVWHHLPGQPFTGGIEYDLGGGNMHPTHAAPPDDYPCQLISCNAMKNHPKIDVACGKALQSSIAGPGRLIVAERSLLHGEITWWFHVEKSLSVMDLQAQAGSKLLQVCEGVRLQVDVLAAQEHKEHVEAQIAQLEAEVAKLVGGEHKKARSEKGKEVSRLRGEDKYVDACKVAKGLEPKHGNFVMNQLEIEKGVAQAEQETVV